MINSSDINNLVNNLNSITSEAGRNAMKASDAMMEFLDATMDNVDVLKDYMNKIVEISDNIDELTDNINEFTDEIETISQSITDFENQINDLNDEIAKEVDETKKSQLEKKKQRIEDKKQLAEDKKKLTEKQKLNAEKRQNKLQSKKDEIAKEAKDVTGVDLQNKNTQEYKQRQKEELIANKKKEIQAKKIARKAAGVAQIVENIFAGIQAGVKMYYQLEMSHLQERFDVETRYWQAIQKITNENIDVVGKQFQRTLSVGFGAFSGNANDNAYTALENITSNIVEQQKFERDKDLELYKMGTDTSIKRKQADIDRMKIVSDGVSGITKAAIGAAAGFVATLATSAAIGATAGPIGMAVGALVGAGIGLITEWVTAEAELDLKEYEAARRLNEQEQERMNAIMDRGYQIGQEAMKAVSQFTKGVEKFTFASEKEYYNMGKDLGLNNRKDLDNFTKRQMDMHIRLAEIGGKDTGKKMASIQSSTTEQTGFNIEMTEDDYAKSLGIGQLFGDQNTTNAINSQLALFNMSVADGSEMMFEMYKTANKMGVNSKKFAKDLQQNLKIAQKYTFKGGVESLAKMTLWAQKMRFNMQSAESMIDKVQSGGLEGVIQQSAKLQVLGGNAAMLSNPLSMMYESLNDPEAYMKRMHEMSAGFGTFNKETGQVEILGNDQLQLRAIAEAQGRDVKDLRAEVEQRIKIGEIDKKLGNLSFTDDEKNLIYSKAQYDKEENTWKVVVDGVSKNLDELTNLDFKALAPHEEQLVNYVREIRDRMMIGEGIQERGQAMNAYDTYETFKNQVDNRYETTLETQDRDRAQVAQMISTQMEAFTEAQRVEYENFLASAKTAEDYQKFMIEQMQEQVAKAEENNELVELVLSATKGCGEAIAKIQGQATGFDSKDMEEFSAWYAKGEWDDDSYEEIGRQIKALLGGKKYSEVDAKTKKAIDAKMSDLKGDGTWDLHEDGYVDGWDADKVARSIAFIDRMNDGYTQGNGQSMLTSAAKITPINDGKVQLAKSHPQDSAIFAKVGGPFDKLFNGVFSQISGIYNGLFGNKSTKDGSANINLNMNGKILLEYKGTSIDISKELKNNPLFVKAMAQEIVMQLSRNVNGGKTTMFDFIKSI